MRPTTERLALADAATLAGHQRDARRCMAGHATAGLPADEPCATWADRAQDELDRRAGDMPLPGPVAADLTARYGRTGPRGGEDR